MPIFIGADHGGFDLKTKLIEYLQENNIRIEDMGNYELDPLDDYPDFAKKVAQGVLQNPYDSLGIIICRSGVGVAIACNRFKGIRCGLGFDEAQVKHIRENDNINVLALASDFVDFEKAKKLVDIFRQTELKKEEKYSRRIKKLDELV